MTNYNVLQAKILEKLEGIAKLSEVYDYPKLKITETPACVFYPIEGRVDMESTTEDERIYVFRVDVFFKTKPSGVQNAFDALYNCIDDVMEVFSEDRTFKDPPISLPAGNVFLMVNPVSAGWGQVSEEDLIVATIELYCRVSVESSD